jgi:adenylate cyclase
VGQVTSNSTATTTFTASAIANQHVSERLFVRIGGTAYVIDNTAPRMTFGRDRESNYVLHGPKASRHHAVIEKRGRNGFVLVDQSTNGTYVKLEGVGELRLQNSETVLSSRGKVAFGHSTATDGEVIEVELA